MRLLHRTALAPLLLLTAFTASATPPPEVMSAAELAVALKRLTVVGNVLYVAAHPDDENTALLAYLARERGVRAAYLSLTRGDGGQNLIGSEKGELIGLIRTQELLAARRVDRAEQLFTRAIDFGYSKGPEETLAIWGKESVLSDVVWAIRSFRPDVIVTRFPKTGEGGHGHHTASAILAEEAFTAAGDPTRFPEQLKTVTVWKPKRIFWNVFRRDPNAKKDLKPGTVSVDLGTYNPLLARSYTEIAAQSRTMHKSQGFGSAERRGSILNELEPIAGDLADKDLLDGVDLTWNRVPGGKAAGALLDEAYRTFDPRNPSAVVPVLLRAHAELSKLPSDPWASGKRLELLDAIRSALGLWVEAIAERDATTPGSELKVTTTVLNRSAVPATLERIELTHQKGDAMKILETAGPFFGSTAKTDGPQTFPASLAENRPVKSQVIAAVPKDFPITNPYWLRERPEKGLFRVSDSSLIGRPEAVAPLVARFIVGIGAEKLTLEAPVVFRETDPVKGELYIPFDVVPEVTLSLDEKSYLFGGKEPRSVRVTVRANADGISGRLRLSADGGFSVEPKEAAFSLAKADDETALVFKVTPPATSAPATLHAVADVNGRSLSYGAITIDYPHIPRQRLFPPAEARLVRLDLNRKKREIGYVMGPGDEVPSALRQLGYRVTLLTDEDLENSDLSRFETIIAGVRAYNTRTRLKALQKRLMNYVEKGGTLLVQYSTAGDLVTDDLGPRPFKLGRDRVTVEEAPVKRLDPKSPLFHAPNEIADRDFDGWVQERGLYFASTWDAAYTPLLGMNDPGEGEKSGSLIVARHGKGLFIYTGLAFFRQLPAGVPGATRLFVNLVEAR